MDTDEQTEIRHLREMVKRLKAERDALYYALQALYLASIDGPWLKASAAHLDETMKLAKDTLDAACKAGMDIRPGLVAADYEEFKKVLRVGPKASTVERNATEEPR